MCAAGPDVRPSGNRAQHRRSRFTFCASTGSIFLTVVPVSIEQNFFDVIEPCAGEREHVLVPALNAGRKDVRKLRRGGFKPLRMRQTAAATHEQRQS